MHFENAPDEARALLPVRIRDLDLRLEGSPVERYVLQLYAELEKRKLQHFRPACYLTDQWGCPSEEPVIGIPFYLADPRLEAIENAVNDVETSVEIMMYMRHEAGHAFNYAYELYRTDEWRRLFGPFRRAYRDDYTPVPFSKQFVRHIAGWYAQKHPDEDFAETFAVWLTPASRWKSRYKGWPALAKLQYIDRIARELSDTPPLRPLGEVDFTVDDMESTIEEFYRENTPTEEEEIAELAIDSDLADIFSGGEGDRPADRIVMKAHRQIVDKISYWTGVRRSLIKALVRAVERRLTRLELTVKKSEEATVLVELTAYLTTLAMNYLTRGRFTNA